MDDKLNWKEHVQMLSKKLAKASYIIYRASKILSCLAMRALYFSLFYPYLSYCLEVWGTCPQTTFDKVFLLQKRVIRTICGVSKFFHSSMLFLQLKILKLHDLFNLKTLVFMFNAYRNNLPYRLQNLFNISLVFGRNKCNFRLKYARSKTKQNSISYLGVKLWNSLDKSIKHIGILHSFKKSVQEEYFKQY